MSLTPFERAFVAHLVADWLLQNNWMAQHKYKLLHPASWVHGAIHALGLWWALDWRAGVALGLIHMLIDTRIPLEWWMRAFKDSAHLPEARNIAVWADQVLHIATIALWIALFTSPFPELTHLFTNGLQRP
jgi:hypothetical protein